MDHNLLNMVTALRTIQDDGGDGNFVLFLADPAKNYYIQFVGELSSDSLFGEAVSNEFLEPAFALNAAQEARLFELGWQASEGNYIQEWFVTDDNDRLEIAQLVLQTLTEVYQFPAKQLVEIVVNLE